MEGMLKCENERKEGEEEENEEVGERGVNGMEWNGMRISAYCSVFSKKNSISGPFGWHPV